MRCVAYTEDPWSPSSAKSQSVPHPGSEMRSLYIKESPADKVYGRPGWHHLFGAMCRVSSGNRLLTMRWSSMLAAAAAAMFSRRLYGTHSLEPVALATRLNMQPPHVSSCVSHTNVSIFAKGQKKNGNNKYKQTGSRRVLGTAHKFHRSRSNLYIFQSTVANQ